MKKIFVAVFILMGMAVHAQQINNSFDGRNWQAPYSLPIPKGWGIERFLLPPSFAPQILYKGVEDIRFTPGWGNSKTDEYWSYAFLWYLDGKLSVSKKALETDLKNYYDGLLKDNTDSAKAMDEQPMATVVKLRRSVTEQDELFYSAKIEMRDFLSRQRITLNGKVHVRSCSGTGKTILFFELSPKSYTDDVWEALDSIWISFRCTKD